MGAIHRIGLYALFGPIGLLAGGSFQTEYEREQARKRPYYVENAYFEGNPVVHGFDDLKSARKYAVNHTAGTYRMNGQLNDMEAKIFENGGKYIETIISGLSESEYNEIKAKQGSKEEKPVKSVVSFSWNAQPKK